MPPLSSTDLPTQVFAKELDTLLARREAAGLDARTPRDVPHARPSPQRGLVGLAISGGGIRSAALSLGVIQALARAGVFRRFDYVSTVSGGGYTGSLISSFFNQPGQGAGGSPLDKPIGHVEPAPLRHLRHNSQYLSPGGGLESLRLPAVVVRGLLLNTLLVLPWLMLAAVATELIHEWSGRVDLQLPPQAAVFEWLRTPGCLAVAVPVALLAYALLRGLRKSTWDRNNAYELNFTRFLVALLAVVAAIPLFHIIDAAIEIPFRGPHGLVEFVRENLTVGVWAAAAGIVTLAFVIVQASTNLSRIASKIALYGAAIVGPALLFGVYLLLCVAQLDSPYLRREVWQVTAAEDASGHFHLGADLRRALEAKGLEYEDGGKPILGFGPAVDSRDMAKSPRTWHLAKPGSDTSSAGDPRGLPDSEIEDSAYYRFVQRGSRIEIIGAKLRWGGEPSAEVLFGDYTFLGLAILLLICNRFFLDVNQSSLHAFYRDRLSRMFLIRPHGDAAFDYADDLRLSALNAPGTTAPYHLLNATLNMQGSTAEDLRGRGSGFFIFSKHFCGSPHTGYAPTSTLETNDPHLNLGTAMAISAAAAAPNMGTTTVPSLVFAMTLLNLRLGYWLPNPALQGQRPRRRWLRRRPGARYLFREARGKPDAEHAFVNVSDGGHLENLGAFELLRRRCQVVVVLDGEADPSMAFHGLITLIRLARIDLGVEIRIDLDELRLEDGSSCAHWALGEIDYGSENGEPQVGQLLYVKSSLTGDEAPGVRKYTADNPTFPHESTADQFFSEVQFEAYRALGQHVGEGLPELPQMPRTQGANAT